MEHGSDARLRLVPADESCHPVETARNFNESMYINVFDHAQRMGGWFRVGNRPNEGHAEVSCCLYLPDGRVGFMFQRPDICGNRELAAGGLRFEVVVPFECVRVTYDGVLCLLDDPQDMADPRKAFGSNPIVPCQMSLTFHGIAPAFGGERVDEQGRPIEEDAEEAFARGHYEQHMRGEGIVRLDGHEYPVTGLGLRDHSWGPRHWQNLSWYRWLPMAFTEDFAMCVSVVTTRDGNRQAGGMVLRVDQGRRKGYVPIEDVEIESLYDAAHQAVGQRLRVRTREREYLVEGTSLSLVPLRSRRTAEDGSELLTRITEAMTRFTCDGLMGYGMSEYLDQITGGVPAGRHC